MWREKQEKDTVRVLVGEGRQGRLLSGKPGARPVRNVLPFVEKGGTEPDRTRVAEQGQRDLLTGSTRRGRA